MNPSRIRLKLFPLLKTRSGIEQQLASSRSKMIKGSLFEWYTACRKGNCKCTQGQKHGPFLYAAVNVKGKTFQRYVGKEEDKALVAKLKAYREFKHKRRELNQLDRQIYYLFDQLQKALLEGRLQ